VETLFAEVAELEACKSWQGDQAIKEKSVLIIMNIDLCTELLKLNTMNGLKALLTFCDKLLFKLVFMVLKIRKVEISERLQTLLIAIINPVNKPLKLDQENFKSLSYEERKAYLHEQSNLEENKLILIIYFQGMIQQIIDCSLKSSSAGNSYLQIMNNKVTKEEQQEHIIYILELFTFATEQAINFEHKEFLADEESQTIVYQSYLNLQLKKHQQLQSQESESKEKEPVLKLLPLGVSRSLSLQTTPQRNLKAKMCVQPISDII